MAKSNNPPELKARACHIIVQSLLSSLEKGESVNLNSLKARVSHSLKLSSMPKLVDIISAIPEQHREKLVPLLRAKPIRTASGVH